MPDSAASVHVLCATPNGRNPGMASVDLAAGSVLGSLGYADVTYWRLWDQSQWRDNPGGSTPVGPGRFLDELTGLVYRDAAASPDEFLAADHVLYWGDFLHMATYQDQAAHVLHRRIGRLTESEARHLVATVFMLDGVAPHVRERAVSYGSTLLFNTPTDYLGPYGERLTALVRQARSVSFRDGYSARVAQLLRGDGSACHGSDAAFLLHDAPGPGPGLKVFASALVFFGRSSVPPEIPALFARRLTSRLGLAARWLDWGHPPAFWPMGARRRFRAAWPAIGRTTDQTQADVDTPAHGLRPLLDEVAAASLVVTDTYHLCVNAWRMGVPAVCLIGETPTGWSVNAGSPGARRDKRVELYHQLDVSPLLAFAGGIRGTLREADRVAGLVNDSALHALARQRRAAAADQGLSQLRRALGEATP